MKIRILGAGLAGLTAAINLAKAGYDVEIFETRKDCSSRFNGDLQGLENWSSQKNVLKDLKSMNLEVNFVCKPVNEIFVTDGISKIKFMFKRCLFYLVKRGTANGSIDQGLKQQAEELGVKIHFNSRMKEEDVDIVATGPKKAFAVAKGFVFETDMDDTSIALIGDNVAFKGYSYLLVSNGYGTICSVVFGDLKRVVKCFEETKKVFSNLFNLKMKSQKPVSGYGYFNYPPCLVKSNRLFVGEAAGLQDALFGFGMRYAITSGYLAAESIIKIV